MRRRLTILLSFAAGATVANLYYSQPLLARIGAELGVAPAAVTVVSTATQLGYAAGLLFLVPLGDALERRRLIVTTTACITVALLLVAASKALAWLVASSFLLGAATIVPQIVVPFAAHLAPENERGRVIGNVMSGLLVGVILSRSVSGFAAAYIGWRTTYLFAAGAMALLAVVLFFALPEEPAEVELRYGALMRSLVRIAVEEPVLQRHALIGAAGFAAFSVFWTSLAFDIAKLGYGTAMVGAFGLIGVTGALVAPFAGRYADRLGTNVMNGSGLTLMLLAFIVMSFSGAHLILIGVGAVLLDAGEQTTHITNQTRIFALDPLLRNRLNAVYMVIFFFGGALGSAAAGIAWQHGGWLAVCAAGGTFAALGLAALLR